MVFTHTTAKNVDHNKYVDRPTSAGNAKELVINTLRGQSFNQLGIHEPISYLALFSIKIPYEIFPKVLWNSRYAKSKAFLRMKF